MKPMELYSSDIAQTLTNNIIYNCPHSGEMFPLGFTQSSAIDLHTLLCSGDSFVDLLYAEAARNGSCLFKNNYARSFMDTNRAALELDPDMFSGDIPSNLLSDSHKVKLGFGSIAKYGYTRKDIYKDKIPYVEAEHRLNTYYYPIHQALKSLLNKNHQEFGYTLLIDCHSMPSYGFLGHPTKHIPQPDIILGNLHGKSCHPAITNFITEHFKNYNFTVSHNDPFAGGYNTETYCDIKNNKHAIQIEINKSLYMNEKERRPNRYFDAFKTIISALMFHLNEDIEKII